jgi:hypothetical protein
MLSDPKPPPPPPPVFPKDVLPNPLVLPSAPPVFPSGFMLSEPNPPPPPPMVSLPITSKFLSSCTQAHPLTRRLQSELFRAQEPAAPWVGASRLACVGSTAANASWTFIRIYVNAHALSHSRTVNKRRMKQQQRKTS